MAGRDEEFKKRLEAAKGAVGGGVIDLSAVKEGPPDPRRMPFTLTEVTFRQSYHEWTIVRDEGSNVVAYMMEIIDPVDRTIYKYSFRRDVLEAMIETLTAMRDDTAEQMAPEKTAPQPGTDDA